MKILHLDKNHSLLIEQLTAAGFKNDENYYAPKDAIEQIIHQYDGIVLRSRFKIDRAFLDAATNLKFIARVGAGLENIDCEYAQQKDIQLIAAPEGNSTAVAEHSLGMLLNLMNKLSYVDKEVRNGVWKREENRGIEIEGKTIGIIGYGNMGKAFAQRLKGFNCKVICYDIKPNVGDAYAQQVSLQYLQQHTDILSLHTPETTETHHYINENFINGFTKSFWFINSARGKSVCTNDLVDALKTDKIKAAGLDVLEYEKSSFENMFTDNELPEAFKYLISAENVLLSPHIAGWTMESKEKLAQVIVNKIIAIFKLNTKKVIAIENQNSEEKKEQWHTGPNPSNFNQQQQNNHQSNNYQQSPTYLQEANSKKILAGLLGIFTGGLGIHKFVLGYTTEGLLILLMNFIIIPIIGFATCGIGWFLYFLTYPIPIIEGIIYLTKSDQEFYKIYIRNKRPWF